MKQSVGKLYGFGAWLAAAILVLIPFHALISVWAGSSLGVYDYARLWKEGLLYLLLIVACGALLGDRQLWKGLRGWPVFWLGAGYVLLTVVAGVIAYLYDVVTLRALAYGLVVNLRFLLFFVLAAVVVARIPWLRQRWRELLLVPAALVVGFGLLQAFVLPSDVLRHVGYGPDTIAAYQTVDQKEGYVRVQSTARGPNALGAYLVIVLAGTLAVLIGQKQSVRLRWALGGLVVGSLVVLSQTYSRSSYIGAAVAVALVVWLLVQSRRLRAWLLISAASVVLVGGGSVLLLRQNDYVQNIFFHSDENSESVRSSNQDRASALQSGLRDLTTEPLGRGPGTAGPASVHNDGRVRIAENYYLQIGQEMGWIGLGLFAGILVAVGWELFKRRTDLAAVALFSSLVGISIINLLNHAWSDDTLSLLWWGIAGIVLSPVILNKSSTRSKEVV